MNITSITNYSIYSNLNVCKPKITRHSYTPTFGARVDKDTFDSVLNYNKGKVFVPRMDQDGNPLIHGVNFKQMEEIHEALKDQPEVIARIHLTQDNDSKLPMHLASLREMEEIHEALKDQPEVIAKIHLTQDYYGDLPINIPFHNLEQMEEIHKALKDQPEVIAKIHLTQNNAGKLPMHWASLEEVKEIHNVLKDQPEVIAKIHLTQNNSGELPMHWSKLERMKEIHKVLKDQPEVIAKIHLTRDKKGKLPINRASYSDEKKEIYRAIANAALNSDLDTESSIILLENYNQSGLYCDAIRQLNKQLQYKMLSL